MMNRLVGLCGYAQTGKDTLALQIKDTFKRLAFADVLKNEVLNMLLEVGYDPNFDIPKDKAFWRDMLVFWGKKQRQINPDYWVDLCLKEIQQNDVGADNHYIITDVRYLNEAKRILSMGGQVFRIHRPNVTANNEEEELSIKIIDKIYPDLPSILNNGTPEQLSFKFYEVLK